MSWVSMEEGFFLYRVALDAGRHSQGRYSVPLRFSEPCKPQAAVWNFATVPAGKTPHPIAVELFVQLTLANVFMNDFVERTHWMQARAKANISCLLFDTVAEIYRRQRILVVSGVRVHFSGRSSSAKIAVTDRPEHMPAVNALSGIDVQLRHFIERRAAIIIGAAFRRMDTSTGTHHTGGILGSDAGFGDDVGHSSPPCMTLSAFKKRGSAACNASVDNQINPARPR